MTRKDIALRLAIASAILGAECLAASAFVFDGCFAAVSAFVLIVSLAGVADLITGGVQGDPRRTRNGTHTR